MEVWFLGCSGVSTGGQLPTPRLITNPKAGNRHYPLERRQGPRYTGKQLKKRGEKDSHAQTTQDG